METPGQPTESVGDYPADESTTPDHPDVAPTPTPADNAEVDTDKDVDERSYLDRVLEASDNLTSSEIVPPDKVGAVLGALIHSVDNDGELPGPLHERFPDHYPDPNES
jgi:hypothetical protein